MRCVMYVINMWCVIHVVCNMYGVMVREVVLCVLLCIARVMLYDMGHSTPVLAVM